MNAEGWGNGAAGEEQQFGGRSYGNSNYRGAGGGAPRRGGGGYGGERTGGYQSGGNGGGGYGGGGGGPRRGGGGGGGGYNGGGGGGPGGGYGNPVGRQSYGDRPQRPSYGQGGSYGGYAEGSASDILDIESNKVGMVIGRGGAKIREIQENFNVHVKIGKLTLLFFLLILNGRKKTKRGNKS